MIATVFGATGPIGTALVQVLSSQHSDMKILAVSRSTSSRLASMNLPNVEMVKGDVENLDEVFRVTESSDIIFCCVGFGSQYSTKYWAATWPDVVDNLLKATRGGTKKFVFCDNLYAYGTGTISPQKPCVPPGKDSKMAVRSLLHQKIEQHMKEYPGTAVAVGSSDFFGPHLIVSTIGDVVFGNIAEGKAPIAFGRDKIHALCFASDFAAALALVSTQPKAFDKFWIAPHYHGKTVQEFADDVSKAAGKKPREVFVPPVWMIYLLSPFWGVMHDMKDMLGIWNQDYIVDDSDFIREFGMTVTPYEEAVQQTVDFFVERANKGKQ